MDIQLILKRIWKFKKNFENFESERFYILTDLKLFWFRSDVDVTSKKIKIKSKSLEIIKT